MGVLQTLALMWAGAIIRNPTDRVKTIEFFNGIGKTAESILKDFTGKGGAVNHADEIAPGNTAEQPEP